MISSASVRRLFLRFLGDSAFLFLSHELAIFFLQLLLYHRHVQHRGSLPRSTLSVLVRIIAVAKFVTLLVNNSDDVQDRDRSFSSRIGFGLCPCLVQWYVLV
jgi:hypothetical protein